MSNTSAAKCLLIGMTNEWYCSSAQLAVVIALLVFTVTVGLCSLFHIKQLLNSSLILFIFGQKF